MVQRLSFFSNIGYFKWLFKYLFARLETLKLYAGMQTKFFRSRYIQNHPSVLIQSAVHHEVFTSPALETQVRRASAFRVPAGETE